MLGDGILGVGMLGEGDGMLGDDDGIDGGDGGEAEGDGICGICCCCIWLWLAHPAASASKHTGSQRAGVATGFAKGVPNVLDRFCTGCFMVLLSTGRVAFALCTRPL
ncbi:MAG: hypothetical protein AAF358_17665 [Pseudomonadota bacterium]